MELLKGLDQSVIDALELNAEKMVGQFYEHMRSSAVGDYNHWRERKTGFLQVFIPAKVNAIDIIFPGVDFSTVPNLLMQEWSKVKDDKSIVDPKFVEISQEGLIQYISSIGESALKGNDYKTAIAAFDLTTEGGIMNHAELLGELKTTVQRNLELGEIKRALKLANFLQEKVAARKSTSSSSN